VHVEEGKGGDVEKLYSIRHFVIYSNEAPCSIIMFISTPSVVMLDCKQLR
jgi:hypothetical protein